MNNYKHDEFNNSATLADKAKILLFSAAILSIFLMMCTGCTPSKGSQERRASRLAAQLQIAQQQQHDSRVTPEGSNDHTEATYSQCQRFTPKTHKQCKEAPQSAHLPYCKKHTPSVQCEGKTKAGSRCQRRTKDAGKRCPSHLLSFLILGLKRRKRRSAEADTSASRQNALSYVKLAGHKYAEGKEGGLQDIREAAKSISKTREQLQAFDKQNNPNKVYKIALFVCVLLCVLLSIIIVSPLLLAALPIYDKRKQEEDATAISRISKEARASMLAQLSKIFKEATEGITVDELRWLRTRFTKEANADGNSTVYIDSSSTGEIHSSGHILKQGDEYISHGQIYSLFRVYKYAIIAEREAAAAAVIAEKETEKYKEEAKQIYDSLPEDDKISIIDANRKRFELNIKYRQNFNGKHNYFSICSQSGQGKFDPRTEAQREFLTCWEIFHLKAITPQIIERVKAAIEALEEEEEEPLKDCGSLVLDAEIFEIFNMEELNAILAMIEVTPDELEGIERDEDSHTVTVGGQEYYFGTDDEMEAVAVEQVKNSLWAFTSSFIIDHSSTLDYDEGSEAILKAIQELYEDGNAAVERLIDDVDEFASDAISAAGRGHFLNRYDGHELESNGYYLYNQG